jgi:predicted amidophosphoribosyltransferase
MEKNDDIPECPYCGAQTYDISMCKKCGSEIFENCDVDHGCKP